MTQHNWKTTREAAVTAFGTEPSPELERELIAVFTEHPAAIIAAIDKIADRYANGRVRSPWPILRLEARQIDVPADVVADDKADRAKQLRLAEQWVRHAGVHYDRIDEVLDELFNEHRDPQSSRGRLHPWKDDDTLTERIRRLWEETRPAGEKVEAQAWERSASWRGSRPPTPRVQRVPGLTKEIP